MMVGMPVVGVALPVGGYRGFQWAGCRALIAAFVGGGR